MSKFMVLGNHRGTTFDFGVFDSQSDAILAVEIARSGDRNPESPLEWSLVSDSKNRLGFYHYASAYDGTCTTEFNIVELNEPRTTLEEMIEHSFGFTPGEEEADPVDPEPVDISSAKKKRLTVLDPYVDPLKAEAREAWAKMEREED